MGDGWKKGCGPYSGSDSGLDRRSRDNSGVPIRKMDFRWDQNYSGEVSRGGSPRYAAKKPASIKPTEAASPKGKYRRV